MALGVEIDNPTIGVFIFQEVRCLPRFPFRPFLCRRNPVLAGAGQVGPQHPGCSLGQLPEDQRIAFEHGVIERRPYAQIAEEQNWTMSKVKISIYRARKRMMAGLQEYR